MKHYLLTRFNVHERVWRTTDKNDVPVRSDEWMEHRFKLFERYCMPSVLRQINQEFQWLVVFHRKTGVKWRNLITSYGDVFTPVFVGMDWLKDLQNYIPKTKHLITSRVDNDDVLAPGYMAAVQRCANVGQKYTFIDHPNGYRLSDGRLYTRHEPYNPFLSLVETGTHKTILHVPHSKTLRRHPTVTVDSPSWIQVIHDRNYINDGVQGTVIVPPNWAKRYAL